MQEIRIGQTTNADVYMDGARLVGRIAEFKLDKVGYERIEHAALGMVGKAKLPGRTLEAIDATIKFDWLETDVMLRTAVPNVLTMFQFEKFVDVFDHGGLVVANGYRIITTVGCLFAEEALDALKNGEAVGYETTCSVPYLMVKSTEKDVFIREIDISANINRVNGAEVWPRY
jgi:P2 family phage contractile tail tube protein